MKKWKLKANIGNLKTELQFERRKNELIESCIREIYHALEKEGVKIDIDTDFMKCDKTNIEHITARDFEKVLRGFVPEVHLDFYEHDKMLNRENKLKKETEKYK